MVSIGAMMLVKIVSGFRLDRSRHLPLIVKTSFSVCMVFIVYPLFHEPVLGKHPPDSAAFDKISGF